MTQSALTLFAPSERPSLLDLAISTWQPLRKKRTWENDLYGLRYWERCFPELAAAEITVEHCRRFRRFLQEKIKSGSLVEETANKIVRAVNLFLHLLGPDDGSIDPDEPGVLLPHPLLPARLTIKAPRVPQREVTSPIELHESGLFLAAAAEAKWTNHRNRKAWRKPTPRLAAPCWWHALWIFLYNSALRPSEALKIEPRDVLPEDWSGRWLRIRKEVAKTGVARSVYLNRHAAAALDTLLLAKGTTVLDWQCTQNWLDECRRQIFERAGLQRLLDLNVGFKGLRSSCASELASMAGMEIAGKHLGHKSKSVTANHYVNGRSVKEFVDRLPQPERQALPPIEFDAHDHQLTLFDFL